MMEDNEKNPNAAKSSRTEKIKTSLLSSTEGCILLAGVTLALVYSCWLGIKFVVSPDEAQLLIGMTASAVMFGRAAGMAFGYSMLLGHSTVIPISMTIETILVLIIYPLFVFSFRHLLVIKRLKRFFDRIQKAAETHKEKVRKYGIIGLFAFVWFPFWMTGPVVGCVIGFLMGLPAWITLLVVLAGTYVAILGWAFFLHTLHEQIAPYSPYAAVILFAVVIVIILIGHYLQQNLNGNKKSQWYRFKK